MTSSAVATAGPFSLVDAGGLLLARCAALDAVEGIAHAFSTRVGGGGSDFDLGAADDRSEMVAARRSRFLDAARIGGTAAVLRQVHGDRIVDADGSLEAVPEADGALWGGGSRAPSVRAADCVPILIADCGGRAAAAVHAGWRGTAAGIARRAVASLAQRGIAPGSLVVALGPAIGACCYEVGPEVVAAVGGAGAPGVEAAASPAPAGRRKFDLRAANRAQLLESGVPPESIHLAPWCTRCREDLFFSYRRDGVAAGRLMASIGRSLRP